MPLYRKRPIVIEARQLAGSDVDSLASWCGGEVVEVDGDVLPSIVIATPEGDMLATQGDWIIKGVAGEFYPCKHHIFADSYEELPKTLLGWMPNTD